MNNKTIQSKVLSSVASNPYVYNIPYLNEINHCSYLYSLRLLSKTSFFSLDTINSIIQNIIQYSVYSLPKQSLFWLDTDMFIQFVFSYARWIVLMETIGLKCIEIPVGKAVNVSSPEINSRFGLHPQWPEPISNFLNCMNPILNSNENLKKNNFEFRRLTNNNLSPIDPFLLRVWNFRYDIISYLNAFVLLDEHKLTKCFNKASQNPSTICFDHFYSSDFQNNKIYYLPNSLFSKVKICILSHLKDKACLQLITELKKDFELVKSLAVLPFLTLKRYQQEEIRSIDTLISKYALKITPMSIHLIESSKRNRIYNESDIQILMEYIHEYSHGQIDYSIDISLILTFKRINVIKPNSVPALQLVYPTELYGIEVYFVCEESFQLDNPIVIPYMSLNPDDSRHAYITVPLKVDTFKPCILNVFCICHDPQANIYFGKFDDISLNFSDLFKPIPLSDYYKEFLFKILWDTLNCNGKNTLSIVLDQYNNIENKLNLETHMICEYQSIHLFDISYIFICEQFNKYLQLYLVREWQCHEEEYELLNSNITLSLTDLYLNTDIVENLENFEHNSNHFLEAYSSCIKKLDLSSLGQNHDKSFPKDMDRISEESWRNILELQNEMNNQLTVGSYLEKHSSLKDDDAMTISERTNCCRNVLIQEYMILVPPNHHILLKTTISKYTTLVEIRTTNKFIIDQMKNWLELIVENTQYII